MDFVLRHFGKVKRLVQVCFEFATEKTRARELSALFEVGRKLNCKDLLLVTDHENGEETRDGMTVRIVDIVTWLLEAPKEEPPKWGKPLHAEVGVGAWTLPAGDRPEGTAFIT